MIMTESMFNEYENLFNISTDKSQFFDRWFSKDVVFVHPIKGTFTGKEELVNFWNSSEGSGHAGIKEKLTLKNIISVENRFSAELDIEWTCTEDTEYLGVRKKGDIFYGKCAAFYSFEDGKIIHVNLYLNQITP